MEKRRIGLTIVAMGVGTVSAFAVAHIRATKCEERAITTIIHAEGRVYYDFQHPRISIRRRASTSRPDSRIASHGVGQVKEVAPVTFVDQDAPTPTPTPSVSRRTSSLPSEPFFEVRPNKGGYRAPMLDRIRMDVFKTIECATIPGPRLTPEVVSALTQLPELKKLIVYESVPGQRRRITQQLPRVRIIWR